MKRALTMSRWGPEGPPPEAYSRVTNPQRFHPLHEVALTLLSERHETFDVEWIEGHSIDRELETADLARPSIRLVPAHPTAAPLTVAFTTFPGLRVRVGRWCSAAFPGCGCDACDETADEEATRLAAMIDEVVGGRFRESIALPRVGDGWQEWELWSPARRISGRLQIDRDSARAMLAEIRDSPIVWTPWPRRGAGSRQPRNSAKMPGDFYAPADSRRDRGV
jgi:Family of unknown function (DUF6226)